MDAARTGSGQVVLLEGEPGVGKTRLAAQIAVRARALGLAYASGRCTLEEGSPPFWPFVQVFRRLGVASVLPESSGAGERFAMFELVAEMLRTVCEPAGLLMFLDDVQWADPSSIRLFTHLASGIGGTRLMLVAAFRDTETIGQEPLRAALGLLSREPSVTRVTLSGLSAPEVAERLADVVGFTVPPAVAEAVCARTNGNPFFVGELAAILADSGDGALPPGVRDAVRSRLGRLSPACRDIIAAAAALGSRLDPAALAHATGTGLDVVLDAIDEAAAAGVVSASGVRVFTHDLIREAAGLDVPTARRLALHQRMAEHLLGRSDVDARCAEVAYHLLEALPVGDAVAAAAWAERAAARAMAELAWEQAAGLYRRAADAISTSSDGPARGRLLLARTRALVRLHDIDGARTALVEAAGIARAHADAEGLAQAVLAMDGINDMRWEPTARALCEEALARYPDGDSGVRARLLAQLIVMDAWHRGPDVDGRSMQALAMAERVGDRQAVTETLRARQSVCSGPDGAGERLALGERLLAVAGTDDANAMLWGRLWRYDAYAQLGRIDAAEGELGAIDAAVQRLRSPLARWHAVRCRATIALARGRFAEASALGQQVESLARAAGNEGAVMPSVGFLGMLAAQVGDASFLADTGPATPFASIGAGPMRAVLAWWHLALGDREEARRLYASLPAPADGPPFLALSVLGFTAELAAAFDDRDTAASVYLQLLPHADLFVCGGAGVVTIAGSAQQPLGLAAATIGRLDDAVSHLRGALDANRTAGMPPYVAYTMFHLARVLARRGRPGDRDEASALAALATAEADRLGMTPLATAARSHAAALAGTRPGRLTRREEEIAGLVAQGLTNRQIAAALHISERTAESHVQHILTKQGLTTRTQIAAMVAGGQLPTGQQ
jgi:DNA-binding CsgD family transcriptional regulator